MLIDTALCEEGPYPDITSPFAVESCHRGSSLPLCRRPGLFAKFILGRPGKPSRGMNTSSTQ